MTNESLYSQDKRLIFRETFDSSNSITANGGLNNGITLSNGEGYGNGSSYIDYSGRGIPFINNSASTVVFRIKWTTTSSSPAVIFGNEKFSVVRCINVQSGKINVDYSSSVIYSTQDTFNDGEWHTVAVDIDNRLIYVDGILKTTDTGVASGSASNTNSLFSRIYSGTPYYYFLGYIDYLEIYNNTLTANEIKALHKNTLYTEPSAENEVLNVNANRGAIVEEHSNAFTNTGVDVIRDNTNMMNFKGDGNKYMISVSNIGFITGNSYTFTQWVKLHSYGENNFGRYWKTLTHFFEMYSRNNGDITIVGSSTSHTYNTYLNLNEMYRIVVVYESNGYCSLYINGVLFDTAFIGSVITTVNDNILIGSNGISRGFDGLINDSKIISRSWSAEEVTRDFNATKSRYGL